MSNKRKRDDETMFETESINDLIKLCQNFKRHYKNNQDVSNLHTIKESLKQINDLVGLESLKKDILNQILFMCQGLNGGEMMHTVLMGPPGVGKTTVAKILAKIYIDLGFLSKGTFRVVGRDELVADYLGQTATKTKKVLNSCKGGVLFIDEAYSIGFDKGDKDSYGKECIDTINKFLSENTRDFVCIIAGYEKELNETFFTANPGLERRFPWKYKLEPYNPQNLSEIFYYQLKQYKWALKTPDLKKYLEELISKEQNLFKNNGGDTDNYITTCKLAHSKRMFGKSRAWKRYFTKEDLSKGLDMYKKHRKTKDEPFKYPPAMMYT